MQKETTTSSLSPSARAAYHYSLSVQSALDGNLDEAIAELEKSRSFDDKSGFLIRELAALYNEKGDIERAIALCKEAIANDDNDVDAHLLLAGLYMNARDNRNALSEYNKVSELDPKNNISRLYAGILYGDAKRYEEALSSFQRLLEIEPDNLMANYYTAKTLTEMKRYDQAEERYKITLALRPVFEQAAIELARLYEIQDRAALALEVYRDFIERDPRTISMRLKLAALLTKMKRPKEAEKELDKALALDKSNREVKYTLGLFYLENKQYDKAVEIFTALVKQYPNDHRMRYLLGSAYEDLQLYPEAIAELQKIPAASDLYANARINISIMMNKSGRVDDAIATVAEAIQVRKDVPDFYIILSTLYEEKKDPKQAEETLKTGLAAFPESVALHYSMGVYYEKTNRFEESIEQMKIVLKLDDKNADALNFIGYTYADREINLDEAEALIKRALQLKPGNGYMLDSLGWVYFRQNKLEQAIRHLKEAAAILPQDPTIAEHLGDAYEKAGRLEEALDAYRKAMQLNPANKEVQQKLDGLPALERQ